MKADLVGGAHAAAALAPDALGRVRGRQVRHECQTVPCRVRAVKENAENLSSGNFAAGILFGLHINSRRDGKVSACRADVDNK